MLGRGPWLRKAALLLALCAGSVGASAPPPTGAGWSADPEEQFLLDVTIRQLKLGEGVRAYNAPEGTCVVLGDFLSALDVPVRIDLAARKANGWAFQEKHRIAIDYGAGAVSFGDQSEKLAPGTIRETPEGWCVQTSALARWFGIGVKPITQGSVLMLQSDAKLPVELAVERQQRAAQIHPASNDLSALPHVRIPYRMWRAPALDFVVSAGITYRASDGARVDRQSSVYAAGEIARLSYDAQMSTDQKGMPSMIRVRAYRSDPDANLLGPLHATHFGVGDVEGFDDPLTGSALAGRGAVITNRPLAARAAFDRTHFEGDLPSGWEAELYRNNELLGFAKGDGSQRYLFDNVQLLYGDNQIRIVLYGPQGQIRTREETINVGQDNVPPGKTWYWAGVNQPGRDLVALEKPPDPSVEQPRAQAAVSVEHGIDERTSVAVLARALLVGDDHVTFVEGTVRRSIGRALIELGAARESNGGTAARAQLIGKIGPVNVAAQALLANDFHLQGGAIQSLRDYGLALDAPIHVGRAVIPAHVDARLTDRVDGTRRFQATGRLAGNFDGFNLATDLTYSRQLSGSKASTPASTAALDPALTPAFASDPAFTQSNPGKLNLDFIGTGHVGDVRLRGSTSFDLSPGRFRGAELSAYWSRSEKVDWEGDLIYEADNHRARAKLTHVRRLNTMAIALTAEAATDGSVAFGLNLNFSLDPRHGFALSRRPLAQAGAVRAVVYRDLNDNGVRDADEPVEKGALVTTGTTQAERPTDANGAVLVGGLTAFAPVAVGIDQSSLADPMLVPKTALQVVVPRPGVPAEVQIGLVGGGDIEGAVVKNGGLGFEGLDLELVDPTGKTVATERSDFDGFFLFERVPYGAYTIRVAKDSAAAAKISTELGIRLTINGDRSVVRLGSIQVRALPVLAAAGVPPSSAP